MFDNEQWRFVLSHNHGFFFVEWRIINVSHKSVGILSNLFAFYGDWNISFKFFNFFEMIDQINFTGTAPADLVQIFGSFLFSGRVVLVSCVKFRFEHDIKGRWHLAVYLTSFQTSNLNNNVYLFVGITTSFLGGRGNFFLGVISLDPSPQK